MLLLFTRPFSMTIVERQGDTVMLTSGATILSPEKVLSSYRNNVDLKNMVAIFCRSQRQRCILQFNCEWQSEEQKLRRVMEDELGQHLYRLRSHARALLLTHVVDGTTSKSTGPDVSKANETCARLARLVADQKQTIASQLDEILQHRAEIKKMTADRALSLSSVIKQGVAHSNAAGVSILDRFPQPDAILQEYNRLMTNDREKLISLLDSIAIFGADPGFESELYLYHLIYEVDRRADEFWHKLREQVTRAILPTAQIGAQVAGKLTGSDHYHFQSVELDTIAPFLHATWRRYDHKMDPPTFCPYPLPEDTPVVVPVLSTPPETSASAVATLAPTIRPTARPPTIRPTAPLPPTLSPTAISTEAQVDVNPSPRVSSTSACVPTQFQSQMRLPLPPAPPTPHMSVAAHQTVRAFDVQTSKEQDTKATPVVQERKGTYC